MNEQQKPLPSVEQSLKYMSWDCKEINATLKELVSAVRDLASIYRERTLPPGVSKCAPGRATTTVSHDDVPF